MATATQGVISAETAAKLLMINERHLRKIVEAGWIEKSPDGKYLLLQTVQGFIRYKNDEVKRASQTAAKSRVHDARARETELRISKAEHKLVDREETMLVADLVVGALRAELDGLGASITRDLSLRDRIDERVREILSAASKRLAQIAASLAANGTVSQAVEQDDAGSVGEDE
jgi:hypothetical protein